MKKLITIIIILLLSETSYAIRGDIGFENGISSGGELMRFKDFSGSQGRQTFEYKEVVFITGEPLLFTGSVEINRNQKGENGTVSYNYTLTNGTNNKLTRRITLDSYIVETNGQMIHNLIQNQRSRPNERIIIGNKTYILESSDFQMSSITDINVAADFFAGNISSLKTYVTSDGTKITIDKTGEMYGYEHKWSNAETYNYKINIRSETENEEIHDYWGGYVDLKISGYYCNDLYYVENIPYEISFDGGYLQRQENASILRYKATFPLFDGRGVSTDIMKTYEDEINIKTNPKQIRLNVPDLRLIKGHWYEKDINELYSLGVYRIEDYDKSTFDPNGFISRAEFAIAVSLSAGLEVEFEETNTVAGGRRKKQPEIESPYSDISVEDENFKYIYALYKNNIMGGVGEGFFDPDSHITRAQAVTVFIRMIGFEGIAISPYAITVFSDNDEIPDWARNAFAASYNIGLIRGDDNNCVNPNKKMTLGETSAFLNRFINYLRKELVKDYRENIMIY